MNARISLGYLESAMTATIEYEFEGETYRLVLRDGKWSGGHPGAVRALTENFVSIVGRSEYYPTMWHRAKHLADVLGGRVLEPEPTYEIGGDKIF